MPYVDKEKRNAYAKNWARMRRAEHLVKPKTIAALNQFNIITWEELHRTDFADKCVTYEECKKTAKEFLHHRKLNRIAIARLAMRACIIKKGGDRRSAEFESGQYGSTLKQFSDDIEVNHKTLCDWVRVTRLVIDNIPKSGEKFDYYAAKLATDRHVGKTTEEIVDRYKKLTNPEGPERIFEMVYKEIRHCTAYLDISKEELKKVAALFQDHHWDMLESAIKNLERLRQVRKEK